MPTIRALWPGALAVMLLACGLAPTYAAGDMLVRVGKPTDLQLPAAQVPADFVAEKGQPLADADLAPVLGRHLLAIFHQSGLIAGYRGWLDGKDLQGAPLVTYDLYAFSSIAGARTARTDYEQLVPGVQVEKTDKSLPQSATVWTDGSGTYGPNNQPFAVAEIVFRVANVVAAVTGYYAGGGGDAIAAALREASEVTVACAHWLSGRLIPARHAGLPPLVPVLAVPEALRRTRRRSG